ncbi:IclR family transcriptional regulator [Glaciimonas sp. PCH181]|uniref:IclR family transcriptional regulator n=1 Tax=Glaciimonas sp. PCH181 TaxID=2133943 RepID=UPI00191BDB42|nr:IclR family transcriptional regulator C-terminal domain-containing protein [Glaciimonas sp. PCH181]
MKEVSQDIAALKAPRRSAATTAQADESEDTAPKTASGMTMVKPVINALHILRYLTMTGDPERAVDIARHLGINQSTCFNILRTLVSENVAAFDPLSKTYTPGIGLAKLVGQFVTQGQRIEVAKPLMRDFAARFEVTVTLWRPIGIDRIVLVSSALSPTNLRIDMAEGQRLPYIMGASGRIFAGQPDVSESVVREAFNNIRWSESLTFETYWSEVQEARRLGYAIDDGNFARGIVVVAAPIYDATGAIAFTVSAFMFRNQFDQAGIIVLGKALNALGAKIANALF